MEAIVSISEQGGPEMFIELNILWVGGGGWGFFFYAIAFGKAFINSGFCTYDTADTHKTTFKWSGH